MNNSLAYRPEINGLRAIAILLVLIYHLFPSYLKSGFIGVDIFFVISGYLIAQILAKDDFRNISVINFLKNRFLRLAPALIIVLASALFFGWFILLDDEYLSLSKTVISSIFAQSNLFEYNQSGYFEAAGGSRPLLHLWSLAVEIQFYIFLSFLIAWQRQNKKIVWILIGIALTSFILDVLFIQKNSSSVFYFMPFRVWEMLIGSVTALIQKERIFKPVFNYIGGLLLLISIVFIDNQMLFPSFITLMPTFAAAFLLLRGEPNVVNKALSLKPFIFIGLLSYSIYLWHWPILDLSKLIYGDLSPLYRICLIPIFIALAFFTTHYFEKPIRKKRKFFFLVSSYFGILFISLCIYFLSGMPNRQFNIKNHQLNTQNNMSMSYKESCDFFTKNFNKEDRCNSYWYDKDHTKLAIIGDSQSNAFTTVLNGMHTFKSFNYVQFGRGSCPSLFDYGDLTCSQFAEDVFSYINREKTIKKVVIAAQWSLYSESLKINDSFFSGILFWDSLDKTVAKYKLAGKDVYLLYSVPLGAEPRRCFERMPFLSHECQLNRNLALLNEKGYRARFNEIVIKYHLKTIDPFDIICNADVCKVQEGSKLFYLDSSHLSNEGGNFIASSIHTSLSKDLLNF